MKVLLIAPISSIHVIRWANALIKQGIDLHIATMHNAIEKLDERIVIHKLPYRSPFGYITNYRALRRLFIDLSPDIIHTHQLTGHATTTALAYRNINIPYLLSMYGSDIYIFPNKSFLHKALVEWVSSKAIKLASTSYAMRNQFYSVYPTYKSSIYITPFGTDIEKFKPLYRKQKDTFNIGIAKDLEENYGIEYLIEGFALFNKYLKNSVLNIIGKGSKYQVFKDQIDKLNITDKVIFHGRINNDNLPKYINEWDVSVIPSTSESFGVSAVEAMACEVPVIVSEAGGLKEVVEDNKSGLVIETRNSYMIYEKLKFLYKNQDKRKSIGKEGRVKVLKEYDWNNNVKHMIGIYQEMISNYYRIL